MKPEAITINNENVQVRHSEFNCQQETNLVKAFVVDMIHVKNVNQQVHHKMQQVVNGNVHIFREITIQDILLIQLVFV